MRVPFSNFDDYIFVIITAMVTKKSLGCLLNKEKLKASGKRSWHPTSYSLKARFHTILYSFRAIVTDYRAHKLAIKTLAQNLCLHQITSQQHERVIVHRTRGGGRETCLRHEGRDKRCHETGKRWYQRR